MKITVVGYGNLGFSLAANLKKQNLLDAVLVKSKPDFTNGINFITSADKLKKSSEIYFFAVKDDDVKKVLNENIEIFRNKILVHCSGSLPASVFEGVTKSYGVFYPLHSFTKGKVASFENIPIFITAKDTKTKQILIDLAGKLKVSSVKEIDDDERLKLHLAAVFAQNFTNHMFVIAKELLKNMGVEYESLLRLLKPYLERIMNGERPEVLQTGPAVRNDKKVMEKHLRLLEGNKLWQNIYRFVSESIRETKENEDKQEL